MLNRGTLIGLTGSCVVALWMIGLQINPTYKVEHNAVQREGGAFTQPFFDTHVSESANLNFQLPGYQNGKGGEVTILWRVPSYRASGVELEREEISSFRIYHISDNPEERERIYEVPWNQTEIHVTGLGKGWHYFSISVVDQDGDESVLSENVSKQII